MKAFTDDEEIPILPDAAYVSDTIPETVAAGEQYTVQVTMLNNGTKPWSESEFIRLGAAGDGGGDAALFGTTRATIAPETTVNPGEQYTFTFNLTAPETPGTYNPRYRLVCDGEPPSWFGETVDKTVQVQGPNAAYISDTIPKTMVAGEQYDVQVTMQNTGTTTWSEDELIRLGAVGNETGDATLFGTMKVGIAQGTTVNPSEQYTFTINMTAPQAPGTYNPQYRMLWDGEPPSWFGEIVTTTIQVDEPQIPDASFVSDTIPATMTPGQQHTVQVTMLNNGTKPWSEDDLIRLGAVGDGTGDAALFGPTRVAIAQGTTVGPEEQNTFTFTMTAPQTTGTYKSQYRMLCDGEMPSWFGEIVNTTIQVEQPLVPGAAVVSNTIPATMTPGQKYSVQVTMLNTGTKPWSEADRIRLGAVGDGAGDAALFGTGRVKIPQGATVEPGEQYTFTFTMTAPETPGTYSPKYRMVWELRQWFGDKLEKTVQVGGSQEPDAAVVGDTIPTTMTPGQQYSVQVTMLNTGTKPWSETDRIRLGAVGDGAGDAALFGTGRVKIPQGTTVGPGEQYTFTFTMTAPETTGTYYPKYRMVWELHQWFGENLTRTVAIA
ncbi:NBR1-Ig-like domain-containing protein [Methanocalculus sp.]|uniref:NBR1-Ig-like domain-containing protein n=1 Tax=Methanocalculus sp. TaxID=2004547 RepID=UPI0026035170|nr:NBR1-Ig-like domain-containing protein [Methanocalculus sp.]